MNFTGLEKYLNVIGDAYGIKAFDVAVRKNHKEVFRKKYGFSDYAQTKPVSENDMQWVYSMTKVITCTSAMRLVERGLLNLDAPVSDYLPEYANLKVKKDGKIVPAENKMLIRHLFAMRSGMNYDLASPSLKKARENKNATTRELVRAMANEPLEFEPGISYQYSLSHDVLAAVIEVISGMTFFEYLKKELFIPLGMNNTVFSPTEEQFKKASAQYLYDPYRFKCLPTESGCAYRLSENYESGGAGLYTTNDDYMKVIDALANHGVAENGYQVLKPETIDLMRENQQTPAELPSMKPGYTYAYGVRVMQNKVLGESLSPVGEFGWDGAACSYCLADTENNLAVVFTTNILGFGKCYSEIHPHIRNLVYLGLEEE